MAADLTRRRLLLGAGAAAVAATTAAGSLAGADPAAADGCTVGFSGLPTGAPLINVGAGSGHWPTQNTPPVTNHDTSTTVQSIGVDSAHQILYALQGAGSSSVAYTHGTTTAGSGTIGAPDHSTAGDLCLARYDLTTGQQTGAMYLLGFGHGVSFGVEPPTTSGGTTHIWTEASAGFSGFGQEIVRFPFQDGLLLWSSHPSVQRFADVPDGATAVTPAVDPDHDILLLRYAKPDTHHYFQAYSLSAAVASLTDTSPNPPRLLPTPLLGCDGVQQPDLFRVDASGAVIPEGEDGYGDATFQGFASYGQYVYLLDGDPRPSTEQGSTTLSGYSKWTVHTSSFDMNAAVPADSLTRTHSEADPALWPREPEGMAVYTGPGGPYLLFALTNVTATQTREFDVWSKPSTY